MESDVSSPVDKSFPTGECLFLQCPIYFDFRKNLLKCFIRGFFKSCPFLASGVPCDSLPGGLESFVEV